MSAAVPFDEGSKGDHDTHHVEAIKKGDIKALIDKGGDIDARNNLGSTPLHASCRGGNFEVVKFLIEKGDGDEACTTSGSADLKKMSTVNTKDNNGWAPIHMASEQGNLESVKCLIENGADLHVKEYINGWTALHVACRSRHFEVVKFLVEKGANVQAKDMHGNAPSDLILKQETSCFSGFATSNLHSVDEYQRSALTYSATADKSFQKQRAKTSDFPQSPLTASSRSDFNDVSPVQIESLHCSSAKVEIKSDVNCHHVSQPTLSHEDPTGLGAKSKLEEILKQLQHDPFLNPLFLNDRDGSQLRPATKDFLQNTLPYIDCRAKMDAMCRKIDKSQMIAKYPLRWCTETIRCEDVVMHIPYKTPSYPRTVGKIMSFAAGRLRTLVLAVGTLQFWISIWLLWGEYLGQTSLWSAGLSHAIGAIFLLLFGCLSCITAAPSTLGVDESDNPKEYKQEYQQHSIAGKPVKSIDELYDVAELALPVFQEKLQSICEICGDNASPVRLFVAPLKDRDRALEKARDDYSERTPRPGVSWLYDIVRGSLVFDSVEQILTCLDLIQNDPTLQIVKAKNRFQSPSLSGYRDVIFHIRIPVQDGLYMICEVQLHHKAIKDLDEMVGSHNYYEYFRSYFAGSTDSVKDRVEDLKKIVGPGGGTLNVDFLQDLIHTSNSIEDEPRLERLGNLFRKQLCEYSWALQVNCKLLQLQLDQYGVRHLSVMKSCNAVAIVLDNMGDFDTAEKVYGLSIDLLQCLESRRTHSLLAQVYNNMSTLLTEQKQLGEAKDLQRKSLELYKKTLGETHVSIANLYFNMGVILKKEKHDHFHYEAMENYQKALEIYKINYGDEHVKVANTYNNMARILQERKMLEESIVLYQDSLKIYKKTVGDNHTSVGNTYNNIGLLHSSQGNLEEALVAFDKSVTIFKKNFGEDHPKVTNSHSNIKTVLQRLFHRLVLQGELEKAMEWQRWSMEKHQLALGGEGRSVADIYSKYVPLLPEPLKVQDPSDLYSRELVMAKSYLEQHQDCPERVNERSSSTDTTTSSLTELFDCPSP